MRAVAVQGAPSRAVLLTRAAGRLREPSAGAPSVAAVVPSESRERPLAALGESAVRAAERLAPLAVECPAPWAVVECPALLVVAWVLCRAWPSRNAIS